MEDRCGGKDSGPASLIGRIRKTGGEGEKPRHV